MTEFKQNKVPSSTDSRFRKRTEEQKQRMSVAQLERREKENPGYKKSNKRFKTCTKCEQRKFVKRFSKNSHTADKLNYWCKVCIKDIAKKYLKSKAKQSREYRAATRLKVLTHYSNGIPKCACCVITLLEFLSIDHIEGGGQKHKREVGAHLYIWLIKNNFPKGFRVLCHNCNQSLGAYGYCPHDRL